MKVKELIDILKGLNQESEIGIKYYDDGGESLGDGVSEVLDNNEADVKYGETDAGYYIY